MKDVEQDIYYAAEVITWLLWYVNPTISKEQSFELILELLNKGMDRKTVKKYGRLVAKTSNIRLSNDKKIH